MASSVSNESQFVIDLLETLRHEKFTPSAWWRFFVRSWNMSRSTADAYPALYRSWRHVSLGLSVLALVLLAANSVVEGPAITARLLPGFLFCVAWQSQ